MKERLGGAEASEVIGNSPGQGPEVCVRTMLSSFFYCNIHFHHCRVLQLLGILLEYSQALLYYIDLKFLPIPLEG